MVTVCAMLADARCLLQEIWARDKVELVSGWIAEIGVLIPNDVARAQKLLDPGSSSG